MKKIDKKLFSEIKDSLTKKVAIYVEPSCSLLAKKYGVSSSTVCKIKNSDTFEEYLNHDTRVMLDECISVPEERQRAVEEVNEFNDEWFFKEAK